MDPPVVPARASTAGSVSTRRRNERSPPALSRSTRVPSGTSATPRSPPRPFCFASRLRIRPATAPNPALTALVERRARSGFRDRLAERDIEDIEHRGDREIAVDDPKASRATLSTFRGVTGVGSGDRRVPVEALLAVWTAGEYLLGGGAYPPRRGVVPARREPERRASRTVGDRSRDGVTRRPQRSGVINDCVRLTRNRARARSRSATPRRDTRSRRSIRRTSGAEVRRRTARQTPRTVDTVRDGLPRGQPDAGAERHDRLAVKRSRRLQSELVAGGRIGQHGEVDERLDRCPAVTDRDRIPLASETAGRGSTRSSVASDPSPRAPSAAALLPLGVAAAPPTNARSRRSPRRAGARQKAW